MTIHIAKEGCHIQYRTENGNKRSRHQNKFDIKKNYHALNNQSSFIYLHCNISIAH